MRKLVFLVLVLFTVMVLSGCGEKGKLEGVKNISVEDIFNQKEDKYFIYFHRIECPDCEQSAPYVIQYANIIKNNNNCGDKRKIYAVLLYTESEKPGLSTYIYREYTGTDGEGTEGKYHVTGVKNWEELYIASTSSLISISTNTAGEKVARYVAQGSQNVNAALEEHLNNCYA